MGTLLRQLLGGQDEPPAWRSGGSRRLAYAAAWGGWALLVGSLITEVITGARGPGGPGSPGPAAGQGAGAAGGLAVAAWLAVQLAVCGAVLLLPRFPSLGWRVAYLGVLAGPLIDGQNRVDTGYYLILTVAFIVAGLRYGPPRLWRMALLMLVPAWLWTAPLLAGAAGAGFPLALAGAPDWAYPARLTIGLAAVTALLYGAGRWRRDRLALAAQAREIERQAEQARQQAQEARRQADEAQRQRERGAVLEERARIAREMHDVVAHHMSMIAVQAETAPYRIGGLPAGAEAEFAALSASARQALTDMRRLLGVLRGAGQPGGGPAPDLLPQPGLADVAALVDSARRAGAEVAFEMSAAEGRAPGVVGLAAYRIVQESLSNAGRHAPGASITVAIEEGRRLMRVTVDNGPARLLAAPPAPATAGTETGDSAGVATGAAATATAGAAVAAATAAGGGHGLAGMRERVALLGGRLSAGPRPGGGFTVRAELPAAAPLDCPVTQATIEGEGGHQPGQVPVSGDRS